MKPLNIAVAGLGTVGCGVASLLKKNADLIAVRAGRPIVLRAVSARDRSKQRPVNLDGVLWCDKAEQLADLPDIDVVCEVIGGENGVAASLCEKTLRNGKALVTANKALLAHKGYELACLAEEKGVPLLFEAAVAGGIPIIKALRESLAGNRFTSVRGILNGTCNYILTRMGEAGLDFEPALAEAQSLGYAESDPSADIDGYDSAHKLALLAALAFGVRPDLASVDIEGIRKISNTDLAFAAQLGYKVKLFGVARLTERGLEQCVSPCLIPLSSPLAAVDGVLNAVEVVGDYFGPLTLTGRGAGAEATASSVVSDLIDIARETILKPFGVPSHSLSAVSPLTTADRKGRFYLRLQVTDKSGVIAEIGAVLGDLGISIGSLLQREKDSESTVSVIIVTHETDKCAMQTALKRIAALDFVWNEPLCLRIETEQQ